MAEPKVLRIVSVETQKIGQHKKVDLTKKIYVDLKNICNKPQHQQDISPDHQTKKFLQVDEEAIIKSSNTITLLTVSCALIKVFDMSKILEEQHRFIESYRSNQTFGHSINFKHHKICLMKNSKKLFEIERKEIKQFEVNRPFNLIKIFYEQNKTNQCLFFIFPELENILCLLKKKFSEIPIIDQDTSFQILRAERINVNFTYYPLVIEHVKEPPKLYENLIVSHANKNFESNHPQAQNKKNKLNFLKTRKHQESVATPASITNHYDSQKLINESSGKLLTDIPFSQNIDNISANAHESYIKVVQEALESVYKKVLISFASEAKFLKKKASQEKKLMENDCANENLCFKSETLNFDNTNGYENKIELDLDNDIESLSQNSESIAKNSDSAFTNMSLFEFGDNHKHDQINDDKAIFPVTPIRIKKNLIENSQSKLSHPRINSLNLEKKNLFTPNHIFLSKDIQSSKKQANSTSYTPNILPDHGIVDNELWENEFFLPAQPIPEKKFQEQKSFDLHDPRVREDTFRKTSIMSQKNEKNDINILCNKIKTSQNKSENHQQDKPTIQDQNFSVSMHDQSNTLKTISNSQIQSKCILEASGKNNGYLNEDSIKSMPNQLNSKKNKERQSVQTDKMKDDSNFQPAKDFVISEFVKENNIIINNEQRIKKKNKSRKIPKNSLSAEEYHDFIEFSLKSSGIHSNIESTLPQIADPATIQTDQVIFDWPPLKQNEPSIPKTALEENHGFSLNNIENQNLNLAIMNDTNIDNQKKLENVIISVDSNPILEKFCLDEDISSSNRPKITKIRPDNSDFKLDLTENSMKSHKNSKIINNSLESKLDFPPDIKMLINNDEDELENPISKQNKILTTNIDHKNNNTEAAQKKEKKKGSKNFDKNKFLTSVQVIVDSMPAIQETPKDKKSRKSLEAPTLEIPSTEVESIFVTESKVAKELENNLGLKENNDFSLNLSKTLDNAPIFTSTDKISENQLLSQNFELEKKDHVSKIEESKTEQTKNEVLETQTLKKRPTLKIQYGSRNSSPNIVLPKPFSENIPKISQIPLEKLSANRFSVANNIFEQPINKINKNEQEKGEVNENLIGNIPKFSYFGIDDLKNKQKEISKDKPQSFGGNINLGIEKAKIGNGLTSRSSSSGDEGLHKKKTFEFNENKAQNNPFQESTPSNKDQSSANVTNRTKEEEKNSASATESKSDTSNSDDSSENDDDDDDSETKKKKKCRERAQGHLILKSEAQLYLEFSNINERIEKRFREKDFSNLDESEFTRLKQIYTNYHTKLTFGILVKKYGLKTYFSPSVRKILFEHNLGKFLWCSADGGKIKKTFEAKDIMQLSIGKKTSNFRRFPKADETLCFSLILTNRSIDMQCKNKEDFQKYIPALKFYLEWRRMRQLFPELKYIAQHDSNFINYTVDQRLRGYHMQNYHHAIKSINQFTITFNINNNLQA